MPPKTKPGLLLAALLAACDLGHAAASDPYTIEELKKLSLEELGRIEVTLPSRQMAPAFETTAAVHVVSHEEIRRSGLRSLPELLRLVPGVTVSRIDASHWAISARYPNSQFTSNLLVLMDGRILYSPLFAGTFWDVQDTMIEDLDRIEVVRGPGTALWGTNAVAGIINFVTKSARVTEEEIATVVVGSHQDEAAVRTGGRFGKNGHYRVYGKARDFDSFDLTDGRDAADSWDSSTGGFRLDWEDEDRDQFTLLGQAYSIDRSQLFRRGFLTPPFVQEIVDDPASSGENLVFEWTRPGEGGRQSRLRLIYDHTDRRDFLDAREDRETLELDFQRSRQSEALDWVWGVTYRGSSDDIAGTDLVEFLPASRKTRVTSLFGVITRYYADRRLRLTLGSRVDDDTYAGTRAQPTVRLGWHPREDRFTWFSASRALRYPARLDAESRITQFLPPSAATFGLPVKFDLVGDNRQSETLGALELGHRRQVSKSLSLDLAVFHHSYDRIDGLVPGPAAPVLGPPAHLSVVARDLALGAADIFGGEIGANVQVNDHWSLKGSYSALEVRGRFAGMEDPGPASRSPEEQVRLHSSHELGERTELDWLVYFTDGLPARGVPDHLRLDLRASHRVTSDLELTLVGQDLLEEAHVEQAGDFLAPAVPAAVPRSAYGQVSWRF